MTRSAAPLLAALGHPGRLSALRGAVDGAWVVWTLKRRGLRPLLAGRTAPPAGAPDAARARRVVAAVDAGLALLPADPTCLRRSVTQQRELDRLGLPSALHVGVRRVGDRTEAHAWLQVGSEVVNDQADVVGSYVELAAGDLERLLPSLT